MEAICLSANEVFAQQLHQQHLLQSSVNSLGNGGSNAATPLRMTLPFSYGRLAAGLQTNGQPNNLSTASSKQSNQSLLSNVLNSVAHPGRALGTAIGQSMKNNGNANNKLIDPSTQNNLELKALLSNNESPATATSSHYALSSMFPVNTMNAPINITGNPISNSLIHYPLHCLRILTRMYPRLASHSQMESSSYSGSSGNDEPPSTHLKSSLNYQFYAGQLTVSNQIQPVTIRALKLTGDAENVTAFAEQAAQLCALGHENVIKMIGVSIGANIHSSIPQHFIIFEQFSPVNLLHFLQQQPLPGSSTFNGQSPINSNGGHFVENVDLLQIAYQIANGMQFLSENGYVHGDLACRNCYINHSSPSSGDHPRFRVKIGGLHLQNLNCQNGRWLMGNENSGKKKPFKKDLISQELKEELVEEHLDDQDYYTLNVQRKAFPVRWLPPECLLSLEYSTASDVWSFGVTLWELMSYGRQIPFQSYGNAQVVDLIVAGRLLDRPTYCEPSFYALILDCWREVPAQRSSFSELAQKLAQLISNSSSHQSNWLTNPIRNRVCSPMPSGQNQANKVNGWLLNSNDFNGSSNYLSNNPSKTAALKTNTMNSSSSTYASSYHQSSSPNYNLANSSTAGHQVEYDQPFVQINDLESSHKLIKPTLSTFQSGGKPRNGLTVGLRHLELKNGHPINYSNSKLAESKQDDYSENHYSRLTYDDETESMLSSSFGLI